ncbi:YkvA family protein [Methylophaga sp.]|uniref:YkvA family protein n=1 Tax=Methylophaga sp. TaxID=2024840 RepID=UPI00271BB8AB|nr:YkvA family protein [Methylophaga sp.]MDO8827691.1 YkvA family protein [Methylophaga sp.]
MAFEVIKKFAKTMTLQLSALYIASKDPMLPKQVKWLIVGVVAYALSPIDLIPDFIPIIGYLDELLILPLGIYIAVKLIPDELWSKSLAQAKTQQIHLPENRYAAIVIIICWIILAAACGYAFWYWAIK